MTVDRPEGIAVDPVGGKIYWANLGTQTIDYAELNGSHAGVLESGTGPTPHLATVSNPLGLAIDPVARTLYWANNRGHTISLAYLDGSGSQNLQDTGSTSAPVDVAVDTVGRPVYWTEPTSNSIADSPLTGGTPTTLPLTTATPNNPAGLAVDADAGRLYWTNLYGQNLGRRTWTEPAAPTSSTTATRRTSPTS